MHRNTYIHICVLCIHVTRDTCIRRAIRKGVCTYEVATISRLLEFVGLFCRISSLLYGSSAEETYDFKEPTNRSHPICVCA